MKSIIIVGDGMSDRPIARLGAKTPLMVAQKPNIDRIAREGRVGLFKSIPNGQPPESDVANLSILGYDPQNRFRDGRSSRHRAWASTSALTMLHFDAI